MLQLPFTIRPYRYRRALVVLFWIGFACAIVIGAVGLMIEETRINRDFVYTVALATFIVSVLLSAAYLLLLRWPRNLFAARYVVTEQSISFRRGMRTLWSHPISAIDSLVVGADGGQADLRLRLDSDLGIADIPVARASHPQDLQALGRQLSDVLRVPLGDPTASEAEGSAGKGAVSMIWPGLRFDWKNAVLVAVSLVFAVAVIETAPRLVGFQPRQPVRDVVPEERLAHAWSQLHETYGWINKTGTFNTPFIPMTFLEDGLRRSGADHSQAIEDVIVVGGSITQGYEEADENIYASKLDHMMPKTRFLNFASGGWGTYQSYLRARDALGAGTGKPVKAVIYGLYSDHKRRNIARHDWITALTDSRLRFVVPPHVKSIWGDELTPYGQAYFGDWPGESKSVTITMLHEIYMMLLYPPRTTTHMYRVMRTILQRMDEAASAHGAGLLVVFLDPPDPVLQGWLGDLGIEAADCSNADWLNPEYKMGGYGYPNTIQHGRWADCIAGRLRELGWVSG